MRIRTVRTDGVGPLPELAWEPGDCEVIFDDNQQGKTTLIDLIINRVFKEGRKQLFAGEKRYDEFPGSEVELEASGDVHLFGESGPERPLSELLGWRLPELHRLLCIRSGQLTIHDDNRDREEMWNGLASLLSGMGDDSLNDVTSKIRNLANLTPTFRWSNPQSSRVRDRMHEELVPNLERMDELEQNLRSLMERLDQLKQVGAELEAVKQDLNQIKQRRGELRKMERKQTLTRARSLVEEIRVNQSKLNDQFSRIDPEFEEEWERAKERRQTIANKVRELKKRTGQAKQKIEKQIEERKTIRSDLKNIEEQQQHVEEALVEADRHRSRRTRNLQEQLYETVQPLVNELEGNRERLSKAARRRWLERGLLWSGGVVFVAAMLELVLGATDAGFGAVGILLAVGVILGGMGALLVWNRGRLKQSVDELETTLKEELTGLPGDDREPLERARNLLDSSLEDLVEEEELDQLREEKEALLRREAKLKSREESLNEQIRELEEAIEDQETELDEQLKPARSEVRQSLERFREKSGCTGLDDYLEKLARRREIEGKIESLESRLSGLLDRELETQDLNEIKVKIENELDEVKDVEIDVEDVEEARESVEHEVNRLDSKQEELQREHQSVQDEVIRLKSTLSELGIDPEQPGTLFEQQNAWEQELGETIRDRLAAIMAVRALDGLEADYLGEVRRLLAGKDGGQSLDDLYNRVMGDRQELSFRPDDMTFEVLADGTAYPEQSLSSGARNHLYFSCRLVLLDRLFEEEPGFMLLDDPFLHYYPDRKERAIRLLEPYLEEGWQVLVFTVDPATRDGFKELGGAVRTIAGL